MHSSAPIGRMMAFIDGENLVFGYQDMKEQANGLRPRADVVHAPDVFVWGRGVVQPGYNHVIRATYYTYATGDDGVIRQHVESIKELEFHQFRQPQEMGERRWSPPPKMHNTLHPHVLKKIKGTKGKGVDIQMTVDILNQVHLDNLDAVYLVSGDGDYVPVLEEARRMGKRIYVAALSRGLALRLRDIADEFIDLDYRLFEPIPTESAEE